MADGRYVAWATVDAATGTRHRLDPLRRHRRPDPSGSRSAGPGSPPRAGGPRRTPRRSSSSCAYAFDDLGAGRVALKTDGRNARSQAAIERLGGVREGTLRRHLRMPDGYIRDTVYYSILRDEWPPIRARWRLAWRADRQAQPARGADLVGVLVRMAGVDLEPADPTEYAPDSECCAACAPTRSGRQRLEQRQAGGAHGVDHGHRLGDRPVVVQSLGPARLVVALDDDRVRIGHEAAQPGVGHRLRVGQVMGDLSRGPAAVGRRWSSSASVMPARAASTAALPERKRSSSAGRSVIVPPSTGRSRGPAARRRAAAPPARCAG